MAPTPAHSHVDYSGLFPLLICKFPYPTLQCLPPSTIPLLHCSLPIYMCNCIQIVLLHTCEKQFTNYEKCFCTVQFYTLHSLPKWLCSMSFPFTFLNEFFSFIYNTLDCVISCMLSLGHLTQMICKTFHTLRFALCAVKF